MTVLARARAAGVVVALDATGRVVVRGPRRVAALLEEVLLSADEVRAALAHGRRLSEEPSPPRPWRDRTFIDERHERLLVGQLIAHPERHRLFAHHPDLLEQLVARGALVQVTAGSLLGDFGAGPMAACEEYFRRGLVHLVASDAHSMNLRPPRLAAARDRVLRQWGKEAEIGIFEANAEAIVRSEALPWTGVPSEARPSYG